MEGDREMRGRQTTFNNSDAVNFQGVYQTINANSIVFSGGGSQDENIDIDKEVLGSLAFPEMLQRRGNIEKPYIHTCSWILELQEFKDWMTASNGLLWIKGKPGAGKSTLMAFLYEKVMKQHTPDQGIALEFFFSARGTELQRTPLGMLRSLLNQLYRRDRNIRPGVRKIYRDKCAAFGESRQSWEWQQPELERILHENLVASAQRQPLIVFVDALDEAGQGSAQYLAQYFHQVNESIVQKAAPGKICMSCRHYPVITPTPGTEISVEEHNHDDITAYIRDSLSLDYILPLETPDHRSWKSVIAHLIRSANGIFQWIRLVVPLIKRKIQDGESPEDVRRFLRTVPSELGIVYGHILRNVIAIDYRSHANLLFQWVCLAERPLFVTEMRYAISASHITTGPQRTRCNEVSVFTTSNEEMKRRIKAWSGGLIEVVKDSVQVIHQSVTDYILPEGLILLAELDKKAQEGRSCHTTEPNRENIIQYCQRMMYYACLNYLMTEDVQINARDAKEMVQDRWPFLNYATIHMLRHATKAGDYRSMNLKDEILRLQQIIPSWVASYRCIYRSSLACPASSTTLLHLASANNFTDMIKCLFSRENSIDEKACPTSYTALLRLASGHNFAVMIKCLFSREISIDEKDSAGNTALHYAARSGNAEITEMLVRRGADMHAKNEENIPPFIYAAGSGHKAVVGFLLNEGFNVNESAGHSGNALYQASLAGSNEMVRILLDAGADVNAVGGKFGTALQAASSRESIEVVRLLLDAGADVNAVGGDYGTALQAASYRRSMKVVQLLLDAGADVNAVGGKFGTALQAASSRGSIKVVQLLLDAGADVNAVGGDYGTALWAVLAPSRASIELAWALLNAGADVNSVRMGHRTTLQVASSRESIKVVRLLLDAGADVNAVGGYYDTPLQTALASSRASIKVVRLLLDAGADINAVGVSYRTAIEVATEVVRLLLNARADVNGVGAHYGTGLQAASASDKKSTEVVRHLLDAGADPSLPSRNTWTAAHFAACRGASDIIETITSDCVLHKADLFGRTPLHLAVYHGHLELAASLLERLDQPPGLDNYGRTPLDWAVQHRSMFHTLQQYWPTYVPTSKETQISVLTESVKTLAKGFLLSANRWTSPGLFELGRCLMLLEMADDALLIFSQQTSQVNANGLAEGAVYCHVCGRAWIAGPRFICETCAEVDLCRDCMAGSHRHRRPDACRHHSFLEIPYPENDQPTYLTSYALQQCLQDLLIRLGVNGMVLGKGMSTTQYARKVILTTTGMGAPWPVLG